MHCETCQFAAPSALDRTPGAMQCQRNPPQVHVMVQRQGSQVIAGVAEMVSMNVSSFFPPTRKENWCGEWRERYEQEEIVS